LLEAGPTRIVRSFELDKILDLPGADLQMHGAETARL
jgi:hypothetical protein